MAAELSIASETERDIAEAYAWYEGRRTGLGEELLSCIDAASVSGAYCAALVVVFRVLYGSI